MITRKRRRRIERMKKVIRVLFFLKRNFKKAAIIAGCLTVLSCAGYFSIRYAEAAENEKISAALQMAEAEKMNLSYMDEKEASQPEQFDNSEPVDYLVGEDAASAEAVKETSGESEEYATSHKLQEPVQISDIYAEEDAIAIFKSFYPDASGYTWEMYDTESQDWVKIPDSDIISRSDELQREISSFVTVTSAENKELMIRCTTDFATKESVTDTASLHVLDKSITDIAIDGDITVEAGQYISVSDIPVEVTYQDGSKETVKGLNGIYFLDTEQSAEESTTVSGNMIETITTVNRTYEYTYADAEDKEMTIRYRYADNPVDAAFHLIGEDLTAPVILKLSISEFAVSNMDVIIPVKVTIQAEDENTSYADLKYAFLPDGQEPGENDWHDEETFDVDITQNGKWIAYCKDASGNIATEDTDIIAVDNKAPYVSLRLDTEETWCQKNIIIVTATDALPVEFFYNCADTGEDSGWIKESEKEVLSNGTWNVKVRDEAGNIAEAEIVVSNIDNHPPIISEIKEKRSYEK